MDRRVALLVLAACEPGAAPASEDPAPVVWVVPPAPGGFPLGAVAGRLGRNQPPQPLVDLGIAGGERRRAPLQLATAWAVPGDGPARAVLFGAGSDGAATDLIDIDRGRVVWRDDQACGAPVVGVTGEAVVCADVRGARAIGFDGRLRWTTGSPFIAFTGERVALSGAGESIIVGADAGDELARVKLPPGVSPDAVIATCGDAGRELFAIGEDGRLLRIAETLGGPAVSWFVAMSAVIAIEACERDFVLVTESGPAGPSLIAIARETGKLAGRVDRVRGWWPARDGSERIEIATAAGVARYPRDLAGEPERLDLPALGELMASRGELRLVRATPLTAALLDRRGVRSFVALAAMGAVLGDAALIATSWVGSPGETPRRLALPPRWGERLWLPRQRGGVPLDAELRDLPAVLPLDTARAVALPDTGMQEVPALALDPDDAAAVYAIAVDRRTAVARGIEPDGQRTAVGRADLATRRWRWQRTDGCGRGAPVAIAVARAVVVCGTRGEPSLVRATSRDGAARWDFVTGNVDDVTAGGDIVAVRDADRITVLDARDGRVRGHMASDDGAGARVAIVTLDDATLAITAERGRVVARLGLGGLLPLWSVAVDGVVRSLAPSGAGVLVTLEDGDAYRIDARTAAIVALPGLGLSWHAAGDLVTGHTLGGPIPGVAPPPPPSAPRRQPAPPSRPDTFAPPPLSTPIKPPPPLGDSWQLTLYELTGGLRVRNDYALAAPIAPPAARGPPGSPLVIGYGPGPREVVVLDPRTGDPLRRVRLPDGSPPGALFGTVVDGSPVAGTLLASPLRIVLF